MDMTLWLTVIISIIGISVLIGFFKTKTNGFGRFTIATLLILLVLIFTSLLYVNSLLDKDIVANVFFTIMGFSGGLFITNDTK